MTRAQGSMAFLVAMEYEAMNLFTLEQWTQIAQKPYAIYRCSSDERYLLIQTGIGKANAAAATQYLIDQYHPRRFVNIGAVGSLNKDIPIGEVRAIAACRFFDVDVTAFGYQLGQIPQTELANYTFSASHRLPVARLVTGDTFVSNRGTLDALLATFPADFVDMELAAIAHVLYRNGMLDRLESYKAPSDYCNGESAADFYANERLAFAQLRTVVTDIMQPIELQPERRSAA